jgi:hypothetical protein
LNTRLKLATLFVATLTSVALAAPLAAQTPPAPPPGIAPGAQPLDTVPRLTLPHIDNQKALAAADSMPHGIGPLRFAVRQSANVTPATHGLWEELPGGAQLWRLRITSPGALSLNLGFTRYVMPEGGKLSVYTPDERVLRGPYTAADNEAHGQLWTPPLDGDELVVAAELPPGIARARLELALAAVNHGFRDPLAPPEKDTGGCNVDVACSEANPWRDQVRSVGAIFIGGIATCSGALINNTAQDRRPFFLTAYHCDITADIAPSVVAYWNYEQPACRPVTGGWVAPGSGPKDQYQIGAIWRADYPPSDMTLLELDDPVPEASDLFFAGWDRRDTATAPSAGLPAAIAIHHPNVEEKRISFEYDATSITSWGEAAANPANDRSHIRVTDWDVGTTEPGSSGSPLFNNAGRIVGQLHGGSAACGNNFSDWYGRLFTSWAGGGADGTRLSNWLDPGGTGVEALDGVNARPLRLTTGSGAVCYGCEAPVVYSLTVSGWPGFTGVVTLGASGLPAGVTATFAPEQLPEPYGATQLTLGGAETLAPGTYPFTVTATGGGEEASLALELRVERWQYLTIVSLQ